MVHIFSIEGNIGSGKSTLVKILGKKIATLSNKSVIYVQEPVSEWENLKDINGDTILQKFYADPKKYAFSFQMMTYISRLTLLKKTIQENPESIIITERSVFTDREVFAKMLYEENKIEEINYQIYLKWFNEFIEDIPISGLIYVNTTPVKSKERVDSRARTGENIPLEYLEKCHCYHSNWICNVTTPVYNFDGNCNFMDSISTHTLIQIKRFITNTIQLKNTSIQDQYMYTKCTA
uniref:Deoxynucleoside kinase domain-containing protein n=1 Tax=viral metagenome TaxID=1070528 RepID=A0A6C0C428_9ZZZZ